MAYGISVPTYYGLRNVTELRTIKPAFTETFARGSSTYITNYTLPNGLTSGTVFFHWENVFPDDLVQWVTSNTLRIRVIDNPSAPDIKFYFRGV